MKVIWTLTPKLGSKIQYFTKSGPKLIFYLTAIIIYILDANLMEE